MPGNSPFLSILADAVSKLDALAQLQNDKDTARHEIRQVLRRYGAKYGVSAAEVGRLAHGRVEDLVSSLFVERERALDGDIEEVTDRYGALTDLPASR